MTKILVTGAAGMLGNAIRESASEVSGLQVIGITRKDLDLRNETEFSALLEKTKPDVIFHCAAKVGGIQANMANPVDFLSDNVRIDQSVLLGARNAGVRNFVYFGSSCMYPKDFRQPLEESDVLGGPLEPTNQGYALAKIVGSELAVSIAKETGWSYRSLIMSNLYGPGDNFDPSSSHLIAATILKAHAAKQANAEFLSVWGDGEARREFTYVRDVSDWLIEEFRHMAEWPSLMNIGEGQDHSVNDYYRLALETVGYDIPLQHDLSKPVGMRQKLMDSSLATSQANWAPKTPISNGYLQTYSYYLKGLN